MVWEESSSSAVDKCDKIHFFCCSSGLLNETEAFMCVCWGWNDYEAAGSVVNMLQT